MSTPNRKKTGVSSEAKPKTRRKGPSVEEMVEFQDDPKARDVKLKDAYVDFIRWDILTKAERKAEKAPKTQGEFAKKWGIRDATISDWRKRADFEKLRSSMFRKKLAADVPEVMADMRKRIKKIGKADEVELWLAYAEGWDRKKVVEIKPPIEFSENDIRVLIGKLPPEKQKLYYVTLAKLIADARDANDSDEGL